MQKKALLCLYQLENTKGTRKITRFRRFIEDSSAASRIDPASRRPGSGSRKSQCNELLFLYSFAYSTYFRFLTLQCWHLGTGNTFAIHLPAELFIQKMNLIRLCLCEKKTGDALPHKALSRKLFGMEKKYDAQFKAVFDVIRQLMPPDEPRKSRLGSDRSQVNESI